jgi:TonB-dependent SusC/RagA subfamily outer membrane receptor
MKRHVVCLIALVLPSASLSAQNGGRQISGVLVPREAGVPFAGAAIRVVDSDAFVCADGQGRFNLDLPEGEARLRITPVGFSPYEVVVARGTNSINLPLNEHVIMLEGVDVLGYTALANGASSSTRLSANDLGSVPAQTVESKLQGKLAGVDIKSNSGAPGGGFNIAFRGVKTILGDANPIIVVDGAVVSNATISPGTSLITGAPGSENGVNRLADINPNDIESVQVLRGPSAAAQYGAHAGNGVIIIRTKRGRHDSAAADASDAILCFRPVG